jgi:RNA polymerase sigma-70 factor (ECF subfamily)
LRAEHELQPEIQADQRIEQDQVRGALRFLTADQRQVIILKYLEDWENSTIAVALNKPVGAIKALQHRALVALRRILNRYEDFNE